MILRMLTVLGCLMILSSVVQPAWAHPFHTTVAEMEWNPETRRYEFALRVSAVDIERALALRAARSAGARVSPLQDDWKHETKESIRNADDLKLNEELLKSYLRENIRIEGARSDDRKNNSSSSKDQAGLPATLQKTELVDGGSPSFRWLGWEVEQNWVWCYFELDGYASAKSIGEVNQPRLTNTLFFDINASQINTCTLREPTGKATFRFDSSRPSVLMPERHVEARSN